jgi:class 3 adenylate cyclase
MARLQRGRFTEPSAVRQFPHGRIDVVELDDNVIGRMTYEPGWRWSTDIKPVVGTDRCQNHHLGITLQGRLRVEMADGTELEVGPGEVFEFPPGHDAWVVGDEPWISVDFLAMRTYGRPADERRERTLASILITDIVDSTARASELGPGAWRELLATHNESAERVIDRLGGRLVKTTGDGILALFSSAEGAVRAAVAIRDAVEAFDLQIRCGIDTGEVELLSGDVRGLAVHAAARISALAATGEVLVSGTTRDLLEASGLRFEDRGRHALKGLAGERQVYALTQEVSPTQAR